VTDASKATLAAFVTDAVFNDQMAPVDPDLSSVAEQGHNAVAWLNRFVSNRLVFSHREEAWV
jgi:hypothetical protein